MCLLLEASLVQSRGQIQYILGVTDWYHKRWWPSTSITHFTLSWFQHGDISSKSHEIHLRVLKKVKTDLFPAVVSIVSMILPCEKQKHRWPNQQLPALFADSVSKKQLGKVPSKSHVGRQQLWLRWAFRWQMTVFLSGFSGRLQLSGFLQLLRWYHC